MKKLFAILMTMILVLSLAACGADHEVEDFRKPTKATKDTKPTETTAMTLPSDPTQATQITIVPTVAPTEAPTTIAPTEIPTEVPTIAPTVKPATAPTVAPTVKPTEKPTAATNPVHTHSYTAKVTKTATCGSDGVTTFTCACGNSYTQKIPATAIHTWDVWTTVKEATVLEKGQAQRKCSGCSATEKKDLAMLTNRFYNNTLDGRWVVNSISVVPVEVYFENGNLVVNCYIVNGYATNATNVSILEMYVKDRNGKTIAHDTFQPQNGSIAALSYVEHTFVIGSDAIESTVVDMSALTVNARFRANH